MNPWLAQMFGGQQMAGGPGGFGTMANNPELGGQAMGAQRIDGMETGGWGGMGSPLSMGLLGAGLGMMQASAPRPGGVSFGEALGGGAGGLLGGMMMANQMKRGQLGDGLLGGMSPGQTSAPPVTGSPGQPPAPQGPYPSSMPPMASAMSPPAVAGGSLPPQYGRRRMSPYGLAYGGV